jgi:hypothetical protein
MFFKVVRASATTPAAVLAGVAQDIGRRGAWEYDVVRQAEYRQILAAIEEDRPGSVAFAESVLAREALPAEERARQKEIRTRQYQQAYMATQPPTAAQLAFLDQLGHRGPTPANRAEASELIDQFLVTRRRGQP